MKRPKLIVAFWGTAPDDVWAVGGRSKHRIDLSLE
jgi:hypothetical protein